MITTMPQRKTKFFQVGSILLLVPTAIYAYLKIRKTLQYKALEKVQQEIVAAYGPALRFANYDPHHLPPFTDRIVTIPNFLPPETFNDLCQEIVNYSRTERSYLPGHKKGGTISYEELHRTMPRVVAFYQAPYLREICAHVVGEPVMPTPINDQSSCSILCYERPGDHIGWHYDYNFYNGRHFTMLLPIVNEHNFKKTPSSSNLVVRKNGQEIVTPTLPNTLVLFEGARVYHKATKLGPDETRILLSLTFCTDPRASALKSVSRRVKDIGFFGIRALWT